MNSAKVFSSVNEAFDWLVNTLWNDLTPEQRKELRIPKNDFNHGSISNKRMEYYLERYGILKKKIEFELKKDR